jgi:DNA modification methylase
MTARASLTWPEKHHAVAIQPRQPRLTEVFAPQAKTEPAPQIGTEQGACLPDNLLLHGDNQEALAWLLANSYGGQIRLIYIDPPFASDAHYKRKVRLRGRKAPTMQTHAEYIFSEQIQFRDRWQEGDYLQFMYERLPLLRTLLSDDGSLWLHCDHRALHRLHLLLEEIFGAENYLNTIVWRSQVARGAKSKAFYFPASTQFIIIFAKDRRQPPVWRQPKRRILLSEAEAKREYMRDESGFFRTSDPGDYTFASLKTLYQANRLYAPYGGRVVIDEEAQRVYASHGGNIGVKYYLAQAEGGKWAVERTIDNLWDDIPGLGTTPAEDLGYPTQKTAALLERIIGTASNPGDWVLDCFLGSGTTAAVAQRLGRRWIGCDNNPGAIQTARRRLQGAAQTKPGDAFALYRFDDIPSAAALLQTSDAPILQIDVQVERDPVQPDQVDITVRDIISPMILEQLARSRLQVSDWRALIDAIAIDPAFDGVVFRSVWVDAPLKKSAWVAGRYRITAPLMQTAVAVRATDILGNEALVTRVV